MAITKSAMQHLVHIGTQAQHAPQRFTCTAFTPEWNAFVETWASKAYAFVWHALGPYGKEPLPDIIKMADGFHSAGATASFHPGTGQITLSEVVVDKPGQTMEKLTHELIHASLALFPEGDIFYEESFVDYSTWIMSHAPYWEPYRDAMLESATANIEMRRKRAFTTHTDYDCKRWAGGLYASMAYGPFIIARLRQKKAENNYTW